MNANEIVLTVINWFPVLAPNCIHRPSNPCQIPLESPEEAQVPFTGLFLSLCWWPVWSGHSQYLRVSTIFSWGPATSVSCAGECSPVLGALLFSGWELRRPTGLRMGLCCHCFSIPHKILMKALPTACLCASSTCRNYRAGQGDRCLHSSNLSLFLKKDLMQVNPYQMMPGDILHYRWGHIQVLLRHSKLKDLETAFLLWKIRVPRSLHLSGHIYSKNI